VKGPGDTVTRNRIRDQRVIYLNNRRWSTAVLARGRHMRATFVGPAATPAAYLTATTGMYGPVSARHRAFG
jgi:hypothetical protein